MSKTFIILLFFILLVSRGYSQNLSNLESAKNSHSPYNLSFDLNGYLNFLDSRDEDYGAGIYTGFEYYFTNVTGINLRAGIISVTTFNGTKFGGVIFTIGPKFFLNRGDLRFYTALPMGTKIRNGKFSILISPTIGFRKHLSGDMDYHIETGTTFMANIQGSVGIFINAGLNFKL